MIIMAEAEDTIEVEDTMEEDITMAVVAKEEVEYMIMAAVDVAELPILDTPATIMATTMGIGSIIQLLQYNTFVQLQNNIISHSCFLVEIIHVLSYNTVQFTQSVKLSNSMMGRIRFCFRS